MRVVRELSEQLHGATVRSSTSARGPVELICEAGDWKVVMGSDCDMGTCFEAVCHLVNSSEHGVSMLKAKTDQLSGQPFSAKLDEVLKQL